MKYIRLIYSLIFVLIFSNTIAQNYSTLSEILSSGGGESAGVSYSNFGILGEPFVGIAVGDIYSNYNGFNSFTGVNKIYVNKITLNIFPNPTEGYINIEFNKINTNFLIEIYDVQSRLLMSKKMNTHRNIIDISALSEGFYILKIKDNKGDIFTIEKILKK